MPGKMLSSFVMMALMGIAAGMPHPECEPCAAVAKAELDALDVNGKYLCCDLTCAETPVAGCGIFGLPLVCKACYDGDGTPAYDDDPVDDDGTTPSTTPAPATAEPVTAEPVTAEPVMPVATPTEMPVASPTPEPVMPVAGPTPEPEPEPDMSMSYDFDDCSPCEEATEMLTMEDWIALENDGLELVCDPDCYENSMLDGCGAFGLDTECRAVEIDDGEGEGEGGGTTSSQTGEGGGEGGGTTSSETGAGGGEGGGTTSSQTGEGGGEGGGTTSSQTGEGGGEGGGVTSSQTGEGEGEGGGGGTTSGSCTDAEIAMCADISPAQEEALAMYDGGGKVIVCDPTCLGEDISHCNYFGLGQLCRGCGSCSECVPCP